MTPAEAGEVSGLLYECYAWLGEREGPSPRQTEYLQQERGSPETLRRESRRETYLVARDGARAVGLVSVSGNTITKLHVLPSCHGAGIGRALYEAAESTFGSGGHSMVALGAFSSAGEVNKS